MERCAICGRSLPDSEGGLLVIRNVPESTFRFSDATVDLFVAHCDACGAVQLVNVPLSDDHRAVYRSIGVSSGYREEKKRQLGEFAAKYGLKGGRVVEVGCGNGQFLEIFRELGLDCCGFEEGADNFGECLERGFRVERGACAGAHGFDAFFSFHCLEHIPEPIPYVAALRDLLKPGGVGLIEVPNYDFIEKNGIWLEFTKDHRLYYRKRTLWRLLLDGGFEIESTEENNGGICLTVVVRRPVVDDVFASMRREIERTEAAFRDAVLGMGGDFAVYGAGHYSQLLLNLVSSKYGLRPKHIFDSNRQKCGNRICGVAIEHRDEIAGMKDCRNVIICCGAYNLEVYNMLLSMNLDANLVVWS